MVDNVVLNKHFLSACALFKFLADKHSQTDPWHIFTTSFKWSNKGSQSEFLLIRPCLIIFAMQASGSMISMFPLESGTALRWAA